MSDSYAEGNVTGRYSVGGLVGYVYVGGKVSKSYATGNVSGNLNTNGLLGFNTGSVDRSYWDTVSTGQSIDQISYGIGLTTSQMKGNEASNNMNGFDFTNIWDTVDGEVLKSLNKRQQIQYRR